MNWKFDFSPVTSAGRGDDQSWSSVSSPFTSEL